MIGHVIKVKTKLQNHPFAFEVAEVVATHQDLT